MSVCAVIPTFNRRDDLRRCLNSIQDQTHPVAECIVVDNASTDGTSDMVRSEFPHVRLISEPTNSGSAGGFFRGLEEGLSAGHAWLWAVDNDVWADPHALEAMLSAVSKIELEDEPAFATSSVLWKDGKPHPMNVPLVDQRDQAAVIASLKEGAIPVRFASWASLLVHRAAIERCGLPRRDYFLWFEDVEFTARLVKRGVGLFVADSVVHHLTATPYLGVEDTTGRFYYHIRNGLWTIRGRAFGGNERVKWAWWLVRDARRYLSRNGYSSTSLRAVLTGARDGLRAPPDA